MVPALMVEVEALAHHVLPLKSHHHHCSAQVYHHNSHADFPRSHQGLGSVQGKCLETYRKVEDRIKLRKD